MIFSTKINIKRTIKIRYGKREVKKQLSRGCASIYQWPENRYVLGEKVKKKV